VHGIHEGTIACYLDQVFVCVLGWISCKNRETATHALVMPQTETAAERQLAKQGHLTAQLQKLLEGQAAAEGHKVQHRQGSPAKHPLLHAQAASETAHGAHRERRTQLNEIEGRQTSRHSADLTQGHGRSDGQEIKHRESTLVVV
jgi:hypothetical protein